ncbi:MAG: ATP-binding cassette domain-containing protein [Proteobacteria bacterium]|nr:ATP-binding cassette domain-containing protein [Pseudomonadota bacterium]
MIEVRQLKKRFRDQQVLDGVDLTIENGESLVIIGRSGGGKSVLLKHIVGLTHPDEGQVLVDGQDISHLNERELLGVRRKFGMLFQSAALFDSLTVEENISFVLSRERNHTPGEIARRVAEALDMVEMPGIQKKKPAELSGGMRKRVGLARAIIYRPEVVFYDEPTTGLDPVVSDSIDKLIVRVCDRLKVTTVVITHDMRSMQTVGRRVAMLHHGRIYTTGTPQELLAVTDPVVNRFVRGISDEKEHTF